MTDKLEKLEMALGCKIERSDHRVVPGTIAVPGQEVVYFSDDGSNSLQIQFQRLTKKVNPPRLKSGGASERGCMVRLPDGILFHAISYHGDIEGWRIQISQGAQELGLLTAKIRTHQFIVSDGREFNLSDCEIEFS